MDWQSTSAKASVGRLLNRCSRLGSSQTQGFVRKMKSCMEGLDYNECMRFGLHGIIGRRCVPEDVNGAPIKLVDGAS